MTAFIRRWVWLLLGGTITLLATGCAWRGSSSTTAAPAAQPRNVYRSARFVPAQIRRLAVLPVTVEPGDWQAEEGRRELEPVLYSELGKVKAFELVAVTPEQLRKWTSKARWSAEEKLPADFFQHLQNALGCDAVLFTRLQPYHAYPPLVVGWNLKLIEAEDKSVLWAADEVFDASQPAIVKAAERYSDSHVESVRPLADSHTILSSPRRFSQYTLSALLTTLPER